MVNNLIFLYLVSFVCIHYLIISQVRFLFRQFDSFLFSNYNSHLITNFLSDFCIITFVCLFIYTSSWASEIILCLSFPRLHLYSFSCYAFDLNSSLNYQPASYVVFSPISAVFTNYIFHWCAICVISAICVTVFVRFCM